MGNEEPDRPDATTAFEVMSPNETDEPPGVVSAPAEGARESTAGEELPPLFTAEVDATPVRARLAEGGQ
ncbi:MAG: hypothetical protein LCH77_15105 [Actinobacteria bacterium]|nr:hypothetical protein [Actinomycetota bacterium]